MLVTVFHRKGTTHDCSPGCAWPYFENSADHSRTVIHDVQAHTLGIRRIVSNSLTIICYQQCASALFGRQLNQDFPRLAMLDRIVHCLLSDVVEMRGHCVIVNQDRRFTLKAA